MADPVIEGKQSEEGEPFEKDGKHPETVTWSQYVGTKESLGKKLDSAIQKVTALEEQIAKAVKPEEFTRIKTELDNVKAEHQKVSDELKKTKEATNSEKRTFLISRGVPEEEVKAMSEEALTVTARIVEHIKPKPDLGGGGGGSMILKGSPMELAQQAYSKSK